MHNKIYQRFIVGAANIPGTSLATNIQGGRSLPQLCPPTWAKPTLTVYRFDLLYVHFITLMFKSLHNMFIEIL